MSVNAIIDAIRKHDRFLITSHVNPEADALGSQLAMYELIKSLGKEAFCVHSDKVPAHYKFLPGAENIKRTVKKGFNFDAVVALDCPTAKRTGRIKQFFKKAKIVINIDHHVSNTKFGDVNWVSPAASSCGEMVYTLYKKMGVAIGKKSALYIYIAILTDTGSFNYSNTSGVTHEIVSDLLGYGLKPHDISRDIYENKTVSEVKLLGKVIATLKTDTSGKIALIICTKKMLKDAKSGSHATENFINYARSIKLVDIAVFIKEDLKKRKAFHVSFRSKGSVDVNAIANFFGGGGHRNASGCTICGTLADVKRKILEKAKEAIGNKK
ncbi:MAG: bifunctional oligoribonuclease/PAP phosphatase NrnA [Candidatus Omnitrophica bacterium]|nr:bifunctional oligoribonuclease/PAP phosphatase NrnA [Candidatus Omnitrophota bacterium]